jgi:limonene 1,2-monooxygenase
MLGLGPGSLPTDAAMIGLEPAELRPALEHDVGVLLRLIRGEGPVTVETPRYRLVEAQTQLAPYSDPLFEIAVAAVASPSGPRLAGRHGLGLLSVGALVREQFDLLHLHWDVVEEEARRHGHAADRGRWRLVSAMHIAETREQAVEDVRYGFDHFCEYTQKTLALPTFRAVGSTLKERIDWINESGLGVIGSPEDAVRHVRSLLEQSGGFGCFMMMTHDWANWQATQRHYELFARHVAPHFQPSRARLLASEAAARARHAELDAKNGAAIQAWTERHARERAARG